MIVIFIEGTDKAGKSTLAKKLAETFKLEYRHCSKPQTNNPYQEYKDLINSITKPTVFDRGYLGEFVYSQLWRGGLSMTPAQFKELDKLCLEKFRVISIHARAPISVILERMEREKEELLKPDQVQRCKNLFEEIMLTTELPVLEYHSSHQQPSEIVDKLLHYF